MDMPPKKSQARSCFASIVALGWGAFLATSASAQSIERPSIPLTVDAGKVAWTLERASDGSSILRRRHPGSTRSAQVFATNLPGAKSIAADGTHIYIGTTEAILAIDKGVSEGRNPAPNIVASFQATVAGNVATPNALIWGTGGWLYFHLNGEGPEWNIQVPQGWIAPARARIGVFRLHVALGRLEQISEGPDRVEALAWDREGRLLAACGPNSSIHEILPGARFESRFPSSLRRSPTPGLMPPLEGERQPHPVSPVAWLWTRCGMLGTRSLTAFPRDASCTLDPRGGIWYLEGDTVREHSGGTNRAFNPAPPGVEAVRSWLHASEASTRVRGLRAARDVTLAPAEVSEVLSSGVESALPEVQLESWVTLFWFSHPNLMIGRTGPVLLDPEKAMGIAKLGIQAATLMKPALRQAVVWRAWEPWVLQDPRRCIQLLETSGNDGFVRWLMEETVHRCFQNGISEQTDLVLSRLQELAEASPELCAAGLRGVMRGQKSLKRWTGHKGVKQLVRSLSQSSNPDVVASAEQADAFCGNPEAQAGVLRRITNGSRPIPERVQAIEFVRVTPSPQSRIVLRDLLTAETSTLLLGHAALALTEGGWSSDVEALFTRWSTVPEDSASELLQAMSQNDSLLPVVLTAIRAGRLKPRDFPPGTGASLRTHPNPKLRAQVLASWPAEPGD